MFLCVNSGILPSKLSLVFKSGCIKPTSMLSVIVQTGNREITKFGVNLLVFYDKWHTLLTIFSVVNLMSSVAASAC